MAVSDTDPGIAVPAVVALVASTGGLRAVTATLAGLPADLPAAVVVLLHQEPGRPASALTDLLADPSALPVAVAAHGDALRAGEVLVIPPGRHLLVTPEGRVSVFASGAFPPHRPSADLLLASLATAVGRRAIAVVLTGQGHDGATGATAVHVHGGTVLATSEATSTSPSMPGATAGRDHITDEVVALEDLPDRLAVLAALV